MRQEYRLNVAGIGEPEVGDLRQILIQPNQGGTGWVVTAVLSYRDTSGAPRLVNDSPTWSARWVQPGVALTGTELRTQILAAFRTALEQVVTP